MRFITAAQGEAHITPMQDSMIHRGVAGETSYILDQFEKLAPQIISNTKVRIKSGIAAIQGRYFCIEPYTYDEVTIPNGAQGYNRIDTICCKVTVNTATGTQSADWVVVQGTRTTGAPVAPSITENDLDDGDIEAWMPVVNVRLTGVNITEVTMAAAIIPTLTKLGDDIATLNNNLAYGLSPLKYAIRNEDPIGYGAKIQKIVRIGNLVWFFADTYFTNAPTQNQWVTLNEKIPEGYKPIGYLNVTVPANSNSVGSVSYSFGADRALSLFCRNVGSNVSFQIVTTWITNDPFPYSDIPT